MLQTRHYPEDKKRTSSHRGTKVKPDAYVSHARAFASTRATSHHNTLREIEKVPAVVPAVWVFDTREALFYVGCCPIFLPSTRSYT